MVGQGIPREREVGEAVAGGEEALKESSEEGRELVVVQPRRNVPQHAGLNGFLIMDVITESDLYRSQTREYQISAVTLRSRR